MSLFHRIVVLVFLLLLISSSCCLQARDDPLTPADAQPRSSRTHNSVFCILPLGDSLTQGVGQHGSYRQYLAAVVAKHAPHIGVTTTPVGARGALRFAGSNTRTCKFKNPTVPFDKDTFVEPHEGHCSWNSRLLASHMQTLLNTSERAAEYAERGCGSGDNNEDGGSFGIDVALLLIGHNDGFQAARHCKLKEDLSTGEESHSPIRQKDAACVAEFLVEFERNLLELLNLLLDTYPTIRIIVGLNPTTHFAAVDTTLHQIIMSVVGEAGRGRCAFATFTGWSPRHTFDSTHPNAAGAQLMAEAWLQAMIELPVLKLVEPGPQRRSAEEEAAAVLRLKQATPRLGSLSGSNFVQGNRGDDGEDNLDVLGLPTMRVGRGILLMFTITFVAAVAVRRVRTSLRGLLAVAMRVLKR